MAPKFDMMIQIRRSNEIQKTRRQAESAWAGFGEIARNLGYDL